ncbi:acyl carrier protein [Catenulispora rubra]|uniref:acyl carrier protein n=1 Tax=Catenulispora rubra TaxID=280293 RepID=UPI0018920F93|nr:acyl carrier protein [Catenulispora rubra]
MAENTAEKITSFIRERFPEADITETEDIFSLGYINSLFAMELVMYIEKTFGITIGNEDLRIDNFRTVAAMTGLVARHVTPAPVG